MTKLVVNINLAQSWIDVSHKLYPDQQFPGTSQSNDRASVI